MKFVFADLRSLVTSGRVSESVRSINAVVEAEPDAGWVLTGDSVRQTIEWNREAAVEKGVTRAIRLAGLVRSPYAPWKLADLPLARWLMDLGDARAEDAAFVLTEYGVPLTGVWPAPTRVAPRFEHRVVRHRWSDGLAFGDALKVICLLRGVA